MDNLGDWLYIIILIVAGISSIFSSAKKKKKAEQLPQQPTFEPEQGQKDASKPKSFWEMLEDEMKRGFEAQEQPPQPVITERKKKKQEKKPVRTYSSMPVYNEGERVVKEKSSLPVAFSEEEPFALSRDSFHDVDELKKAIIYSEILNRKY